MSDALTAGTGTIPPAAPAARFCIACNYNLHGLTSHRCPECGRPFDPAAPSSFVIRPLTLAARLVLRTRNWSVLLFLAAAFICWLASYCMPGRWSAGCAACGWIWLSLLMLILWQFGLFQFFVSRYFLVSGLSFNRRPLILAAGCLVVLLVLDWTSLPRRLVFWLSRPGLDEVAKSVYASQGTGGLGWIGLYSLERVHFEHVELQRAQKRGGGTFKIRVVCFAGDEDSENEDVWLVYCPEGNLRDLPRDFRDQFINLGGGWYEWREGPASCPLVQRLGRWAAPITPITPATQSCPRI